VACHGAAAELLVYLESLFQRAGARLHLEPAATADGHAGGTRHGFSLTAPEQSRLNTLATSNISLCPVRGLPGFLRGSAPELCTVIAGIPGDVDRNTLLDCIDLVAGTLEKGSTVAVAEREQWLSVLSDELPDADLLQYTAPEAMTALVKAPPAVLLLPENLAGVFAAAAVGLSGTDRLAFEVQGESGVVQVGQRVDSPDIVEPYALILSSVWLHLALGEHDAAERLHNAVLSSVEDGLRTRSMSLSNPYTRVLSPIGLIKAVEDRLDSVPRHLPRVRYAPTHRRTACRPNLVRIG
jgi:hypothetical protein